MAVRTIAQVAKNGVQAGVLGQSGYFVLMSVLGEAPNWEAAAQFQWEHAASEIIAFVEELQLLHGEKGQVSASDLAARIASSMRVEISQQTYAEKIAWQCVAIHWFKCISPIAGVDVQASAAHHALEGQKKVAASKPKPPEANGVAEAISQTFKVGDPAPNGISGKVVTVQEVPTQGVKIAGFVKMPVSSGMASVIDIRIADLKAKIAALEKFKNMMVSDLAINEALGDIFNILQGD